jgi:multifunctional 2-oxoglutarate metabolism enzyme
VLGEREPLDPATVRRVLLCSGKVYYDLAAKRAANGLTDSAIIRCERLYPLPGDELAAEVARYPRAEQVMWIQEEPANMGAWPYMALRLPGILGRTVDPVSPPASSAPAVGSAKAHADEQARLVEAALSIDQKG